MLDSLSCPYRVLARRYGTGDRAAEVSRNGARPHRGLQLSQPIPSSVTTIGGGAIIGRDILGGIVCEYDRAAA